MEIKIIDTDKGQVEYSIVGKGIPREKYVPSHYVKQTTTQKDEALEKALELIKQQTF